MHAYEFTSFIADANYRCRRSGRREHATERQRVIANSTGTPLMMGFLLYGNARITVLTLAAPSSSMLANE